MARQVRLRFAPSPTGGLHLGGVRTVLYNYLFARRHGGDFILRIEDTDQTRYVPGAEQYIFDSLAWCGLEPDEGPHKGGAYGPYRQSERKALGIYEKYARQLIDQGHAYYAFDTPGELDAMREKYKTPENPTPQYNFDLRRKMRNSLHLPADETQRLLAAGTPYTIRIRMEPNQRVRFTDMIRGEVVFSTDGVDDKVLLKADGMPTYHLAVVVDDHLMDISHAFRGEEWLPSAPVHILLWTYLFGIDKMPQWAHLPLILKPDGHGKLSKRDGDRLGFPVFAMNWTDPKTGETATGFRETGFLPQAFVNLLALLGWNDGTGQELFTMEELIECFSWTASIRAAQSSTTRKPNGSTTNGSNGCPPAPIAPWSRPYFHEDPATETVAEADLAEPDKEKFEKVLDLVKERCHLLPDFFHKPVSSSRLPRRSTWTAIRPKWTDGQTNLFCGMHPPVGTGARLGRSHTRSRISRKWPRPRRSDRAICCSLPDNAGRRQIRPPCLRYRRLLGRGETIRRIRHVLSLTLRNTTPSYV